MRLPWARPLANVARARHTALVGCWWIFRRRPGVIAFKRRTRGRPDGNQLLATTSDPLAPVRRADGRAAHSLFRWPRDEYSVRSARFRHRARSGLRVHTR